ncbi:uncharacterized protein B0H18DRAFT_1111152 [Fomitopsis serialis]|uniref:uncharacterized protein n=1 Tax=Fomitopsis serialis TaxID=139415 RepID=UPI002007BF6F|nr:uncharacterized protein B0H18DRAFT_1111152 [Neoantrodia serialis]KAH9910226.1 hypothetical protein B0H18DRAFT_1111152 [Neoantrodia serialis]
MQVRRESVIQAVSMRLRRRRVLIREVVKVSYVREQRTNIGVVRRHSQTSPGDEVLLIRGLLCTKGSGSAESSESMWGDGSVVALTRLWLKLGCCRRIHHRRAGRRRLLDDSHRGGHSLRQCPLSRLIDCLSAVLRSLHLGRMRGFPRLKFLYARIVHDSIPNSTLIPELRLQRLREGRHFAEIDHQSETVTSPFIGKSAVSSHLRRRLMKHCAIMRCPPKLEKKPEHTSGRSSLTTRSLRDLEDVSPPTRPSVCRRRPREDHVGCLITEVVFPGFAWEDHAFLTRTELEKLYGGSDKGKEWAAYVKNG